jgi:transposase
MEWPAPSRRSRYDPGLIIEGRTTAMEIATLGLDLGKRVVHVVGLDRAGSIVLRRRVSRDRVLTLTANLPRCVIGLEACCGAHHLGRNLTAQGHDVRLMPPEYVRPYVKNNKNDYRDGEAAAEAAGRRQCASCRLRARRRSTCSRCIGSARAWWRGALRSSTKCGRCSSSAA